MKKIVTLILYTLFSTVAICQQWTMEELQKANTFFDEYR